MDKQLFYDFEEVKAIPLEMVCKDMYGITLKENRNKLKGSIRGEKEPSFEIDRDKNLWYDFGLAKGGSPVELVQYLDNVDWKTACEKLGKTFGLMPINASREYAWQPLTNGQYAKIGIQADAVSKNIDFDLEKYSIEQAQKLSDVFSKTTIQELALKKPKSYHQILQRKAVPYVYQSKQDYYVLLSQLAKLNDTESLEYKLVRGSCEEAHKQYKEMYDLLKRAVQSKAIMVGKLNISDIDTDLELMKSGKIQFETGTINYSDLKKSIKGTDEKLRYITVSDAELNKLKESGLAFACYSTVNENKVCVTEENFMTALTEMERKYKVVSDNKKSVEAKTETKPKNVDFVEANTTDNQLLYFSELPKQKQDAIISTWYQRRSERFTQQGKTDELKTIDEYREMFEKNKSFKYDNELKAHRVSNTIERYGTIDYSELKKNNPYYMTFDDIDKKELFATLEKANFPFSARVVEDNVKITIPANQKEKFNEITKGVFYKQYVTMSK